MDFVVSSDGKGTHTTLFGSKGALAAALAAGGKRLVQVWPAQPTR